MPLTSQIQRAIRAISRPDEGSLVHLAFRLLRVRSGTMVDVGACFGSVLLPFARGGWTVHAFEPDTSNRQRLQARTRELPNVVIDPRAVSELDGERLDLYRSDVSVGISSLTPFHPSHLAAQEVETVTLATYCEDAGLGRIDLLKVDAEGHDLFVLRGVDWEKQAPRVVICEFEDRKTLGLGYSYRDEADYLVERGYRVLVSEWCPVVEYGVEHRWRRFRVYPSALSDPGAWGNLIAARDGRAFAVLRGLAALHGPTWHLWPRLTALRRRVGECHC